MIGNKNNVLIINGSLNPNLQKMFSTTLWKLFRNRGEIFEVRTQMGTSIPGIESIVIGNNIGLVVVIHHHSFNKATELAFESSQAQARFIGTELNVPTVAAVVDNNHSLNFHYAWNLVSPHEHHMQSQVFTIFEQVRELALANENRELHKFNHEWPNFVITDSIEPMDLVGSLEEGYAGIYWQPNLAEKLSEQIDFLMEHHLSKEVLVHLNGRDYLSLTKMWRQIATIPSLKRHQDHFAFHVAGVPFDE